MREIHPQTMSVWWNELLRRVGCWWASTSHTQSRQWKQSQRDSWLSEDPTEATVLTVNTHTLCMLSAQITYTHTHTHTYRTVPVQDLMSYPRAENSTHTWRAHTHTHRHINWLGSKCVAPDEDKDIHAGVSNKVWEAVAPPAGPSPVYIFFASLCVLFFLSFLSTEKKVLYSSIMMYKIL